MTGKVRILAALNHKETDKLPIDYGAMKSTGISGMSYIKLKECLEIPGGSTKPYGVMQQLCIREEWHLDRFEIDAIDLARGFADNPDDWQEGELPDGSKALLPTWLSIKKESDQWVCRDKDGDRLWRDLFENGQFLYRTDELLIRGIHLTQVHTRCNDSLL